MARNWTRSEKYATWPGCAQCEHFQEDITCAAYPDGIAILIASGEVDHLVKRPGQEGDILFEPKETEDDEEKE